VGRIVLVVIAVILVLAGFGGCNGYNTLVGLEEGVDTAWSNVENVYQRRADLVPNLVATVKGAAEFEQETLTAVTEARARATQVTLSPEMLNDPQALQRFQAAQGELGGALSRLLVAVERYPDIKANQNFRDLQAQLEGTENRIAVERRKFNEAAQTFNTKVRRFPTNLLASMTGFERKAYFEADEGAAQVPTVEF
jgi:LemA protein